MLTSKKNLFADYGVSKPQKTVDPQARRLQLEKEFFEAAANLVAKTKALEEIKRDKLYQQVCETWEEYCEKILGRSVGAIRLQFRAFDISEDLQNRHKMTIPPLSENELHKMARLPDQEVKELLSVDLPDLSEKIAAKTKATKAKHYVSSQISQAKTGSKKDPRALITARSQRRDRALAKLRNGLEKDEEGLLEAVEKLLEDWGL